MNEMNFRPITADNIEACVDVFISTYNRPPWNYQWNRDNAITYLNEYVSSQQFVGFAVLDGDNVAGAFLAHTKTWWTNTQLFIDELFVSPLYQKKGLGKQLMDKAVRYAEENNLLTITLMTNKFMPAMGFYLNSDFIHAQPFVILFKTVERLDTFDNAVA